MDAVPTLGFEERITAVVRLERRRSRALRAMAAAAVLVAAAQLWRRLSNAPIVVSGGALEAGEREVALAPHADRPPSALTRF